MARRLSDRCRGVSFLTIFMLVGGCGAKGSRVDVSGHVNINGAPLAEGTISFLPEGAAGPTAGALIKDGAYAATVAPGEKIVSIRGYRKVGAKKMEESDLEIPVKEQIVPDRYNIGSTTRVTIDSGSKKFDFNLDAK